MGQGSTQRVTLGIRGMGCAGCVAGIEQTLTRVEGVREVAVTLAKGQAVVEYDPALTNPQALAARVTATGYEVAALSGGEAVSRRAA